MVTDFTFCIALVVYDQMDNDWDLRVPIIMFAHILLLWFSKYYN